MPLSPCVCAGEGSFWLTQEGGAELGTALQQMLEAYRKLDSHTRLAARASRQLDSRQGRAASATHPGMLPVLPGALRTAAELARVPPDQQQLACPAAPHAVQPAWRARCEPSLHAGAPPSQPTTTMAPALDRQQSERAAPSPAAPPAAVPPALDLSRMGPLRLRLHSVTAQEGGRHLLVLLQVGTFHPSCPARLCTCSSTACPPCRYLAVKRSSQAPQRGMRRSCRRLEPLRSRATAPACCPCGARTCALPHSFGRTHQLPCRALEGPAPARAWGHSHAQPAQAWGLMPAGQHSARHASSKVATFALPSAGPCTQRGMRPRPCCALQPTRTGGTRTAAMATGLAAMTQHICC